MDYREGKIKMVIMVDKEFILFNKGLLIYYEKLVTAKLIKENRINKEVLK